MVVVDRESLVISLFKLIKHSWLCWLRYAYCGGRSFRATELPTTTIAQALPPILLYTELPAVFGQSFRFIELLTTETSQALSLSLLYNKGLLVLVALHSIEHF